MTLANNKHVLDEPDSLLLERGCTDINEYGLKSQHTYDDNSHK